ncbi:MAG: hypothetical protein IKS12_04795 [Eubacterium sp.]|nr:hypothetical protein [Eubacterium sp.]
MAQESQRDLREEFRKNKLDNMSDREVLELILSYSKKGEQAGIMADRLLEEYFSLEGVLNVRPKRLIAYDRIDKRSAVLISLFKKIAEQYYISKNDKVRYLRKTDDIKEYTKNVLALCPVEKFLIICLDKRYRILNCEIISDGNGGRTYINESKLLDRLVTYRTQKAIIAHNHPQTDAMPSAPDIYTTKRLEELFNSMGIELLDHIIVSKSSVVSMRYDTDCLKPEEDDC